MPTDAVQYRTIQGMAGSLFPDVSDVADTNTLRLSDDQVASYHANGFVKGPKVLDDAQIESLREGLEQIRTGENPRLGELYEIDEVWKEAPDEHVFHFLGAWRIDEAFHDILYHPAVTIPVSQLLGTEQVRFWHDQVFYKPPRHPGVVAWHQDYSYWTRSVPVGHLTVWIALDNVTDASGGINFIPESHEWDLLPPGNLLNDMDAIQDELTTQQVAQWDPTPMEIKAGECSFHHCMTVHGSYGNNADIPRRGVVLNYMKPDTRSADGAQPLLLHTPVIPEGQVIEGDDFPIVYDGGMTG
jgi:hypothetical protein